MKAKSFVVSSIMIFITSSCFSQIVNSGIYFTAEDYVTHKLSFAINCKTEKHKIKSDLIFHPKEISIKHNDSTYTYPKDSIYGIKYCDGSVVRIYNNSEYPLLNPSETILIYKVVSIVPGKTSRSEKKYYFSKDYKSKIEILSIDNIKSAFPDNHKFHDLIDEGFRNDTDLRDYDNFHKIMKINRVLQKSLEVK